LTTMSYEVTAKRKRPQNFDALVGQEFVAATLRSSITQGRIAHAYLFAGPRGVGKTSVARILAKALNCEKGPTDKPCGVCGSCREISRSASLDVIEIDGASNTSVNDVREIRDEVLFAPNNARYKVYIIDEVHMLSNSAFNALLKTIEEPPPYIVFIFATTEVHKVPATIRSRCQQYNFRLISTAEIKENLKTVAAELGIQAEERALTWIAKEATGSLRDAQTLFDQVVSFSGGAITLEKIREKLGVLGIDELNDFVRLLRAGDTGKVLERMDKIITMGVSLEQFTTDLAEFFRNLLFIKNGITRDTLLGYAAEDFDKGILDSLSAPQIEKAIELLLSLYRNIRFSLNQRFELELALVRLSDLDALITPAEIRQAISGIRAGVLAEPGVKLSAPRAEAPAAPAAEPQDPADVFKKLLESFRREKPSIFSSLEKAASVSAGDGELNLIFHARDKFAGERIIREREAVSARVSEILGKATRVKVSFQEAPAESAAADPRVELLRRVFRGEVVKGEGHGDQPL
jgi:DNA polymerase III subunit gamma/tau